MKNNLMFIFAFVIIICVNFVSACVSYPIIETKNGEIYITEFNETEIINSLSYYKTNYSKFNLDDNDLIILKDFVKNGYSVKEQTDEEYELFLKQAKSKKGWFCSEYYKAVARKGDWTGYVKDKKLTTLFFFSCKIATFKCSEGYSNIVWNDLKK